ncbi:hypothetical protein OIS_03496 [Enterococcus faecium EnGen0035]|nr:hypothetical protein OIS_03496 [Enterococcus faecium EnGen0035]EMF0318513.1 acyltransferase [Enterococcus faecium]NTJ29726.1 acyltransferase [Enterococcus faecium]
MGCSNGYVGALFKVFKFGGGDIKEILWKITDFMPGVVILLALSGYLISYSIERTSSTKTFIVKRIMRIYPELWLSTIINIVVILVLVPHLIDTSFIIWILTQFFGVANTPKCLKTFATGSINGALWTIFVEIQLYLIAVLVYRWIKKGSKTIHCVGALVAAFLNVIIGFLAEQQYDWKLLKIVDRSFIPYFLWFYIGMLIYLYRDILILFLRKLTPMLFVLQIVLKITNFQAPGYYASIIDGNLCLQLEQDTI